jgi:hypothetical protein
MFIRFFLIPLSMLFTIGLPALAEPIMLQSAEVGKSYSANLGIASRFSAATLPPGLSISTRLVSCTKTQPRVCQREGTLAGIPLQVGTYTFQVRLRLAEINQQNRRPNESREYTLVVEPKQE